MSAFMEKSFAPYVERVVPVALKGMEDQELAKARSMSMATLANCIACMEDSQKVELMKKLFPAFTKMAEVAITNKNIKEAKRVVKGLQLCIKAINENIDNHKQALMSCIDLNVCGQIMKQVLSLVDEVKSEQIKQIQEKKAGDDLDQEDEEEIKNELAKITKASTQVMELAGQLCGGYGEDCAQVIRDNCQKFFANHVQQYSKVSHTELEDSLIFFSDFVEYSNQKDYALMLELTVKFMEIYTDCEDDIIKYINYAFGLFGFFVPQDQFAKLLPGVVKCLKTTWQQEGAFEEENLEATQFAIGAMLKVVMKQQVDAKDAQFCLSKLPLTEVHEEDAQKTHKIFLEEIIAGNANLMANKDAVVNAVQQIKSHYEANKDSEGESQILKEEDEQLLAKVLSM
jgi:predicted metal-binding protein